MKKHDDIELLVAAVVTLIALLIIFWPGKARASGSDDIVKMRIVYSVIGEAEGETFLGKKAVACAILNRVSKYGSLDKALKGVYGEHSPRVRNRMYSSKVLVDAVRAYEESLEVGSCDFIDGAYAWEGTAFKTPYWVKNMTLVATIGRQNFYK